MSFDYDIVFPCACCGEKSTNYLCGKCAANTVRAEKMALHEAYKIQLAENESLRRELEEAKGSQKQITRQLEAESDVQYSLRRELAALYDRFQVDPAEPDWASVSECLADYGPALDRERAAIERAEKAEGAIDHAIRRMACDGDADIKSENRLELFASWIDGFIRRDEEALQRAEKAEGERDEARAKLCRAREAARGGDDASNRVIAALSSSAPCEHAEKVKALRDQGTDDKQVFFYERQFYVLSNFSAFALEWRGRRFDTSEAAYHWEKFPNHSAIRESIWLSTSAHEALKIAEREIQYRRADWEQVRVDIMRDILRAKADQHEYVRRKLLETGDRELIENSWRDSFWGWAPDGQGQNMLGKLWMEIRAELRRCAEGGK